MHATPSPGSRLLGVIAYPVQLLVHTGLLGLVVASAAPLFADRLPPLAALESFRPHLAAAGLLLALPALLFRPRWFALAGPLAFAWNIGPVWPYLPLDGILGRAGAVADAGPAQPGGRALKVVSANVWYRNDSFDAALNYFESSNADVIAVIEASPQWEKAADALAAKYPYRVGCLDAMPPCEMLLLSRYAFVKSFAGRIEGHSPVIAWGEIVFGGKPVVVAATHLSWPLKAAVGNAGAGTAGTLQPPVLRGAQPLLQSQQAHSLAEYLKRLGPDLVLMGDFNSVPWSRTLTALRAATGLQDAGPMVPTWPSWQPQWVRLPIDHIMTRGALTRLDFKSGSYIGSDHLPVEAEIAVGP